MLQDEGIVLSPKIEDYWNGISGKEGWIFPLQITNFAIRFLFIWLLSMCQYSISCSVGRWS